MAGVEAEAGAEAAAVLMTLLQHCSVVVCTLLAIFVVVSLLYAISKKEDVVMRS